MACSKWSIFKKLEDSGLVCLSLWYLRISGSLRTVKIWYYISGGSLTWKRLSSTVHRPHFRAGYYQDRQRDMTLNRPAIYLAYDH